MLKFNISRNILGKSNRLIALCNVIFRHHYFLCRKRKKLAQYSHVKEKENEKEKCFCAIDMQTSDKKVRTRDLISLILGTDLGNADCH